MSLWSSFLSLIKEEDGYRYDSYRPGLTSVPIVPITNLETSPWVQQSVNIVSTLRDKVFQKNIIRGKEKFK